VPNHSEGITLNLNYEIQKVREYSDFSLSTEDMTDQYVQLGTLEEVETFHMFLMRDLYREEKPIEYAEADTAGREMDKKYYIIPLRRC
jgi:hypothetical protein